ncbi:hypothetical protein MLD38_005141 [Melastoma candidum]|uniref:Uncharacterized protein n=1 Tax=Melastoma candidum TaxID=119954 RepID=A0ACB9S7N5_9MYRT|nr:hypothetical protein MLD38_005141 [Melastoma candidum]
MLGHQLWLLLHIASVAARVRANGTVEEAGLVTSCFERHPSQPLQIAAASEVTTASEDVIAFVASTEAVAEIGVAVAVEGAVAEMTEDLLSALSKFMAIVCMSETLFCTTGLPTDVVVEVDGMAFHLHKLEGFPGGSDAFETVAKFCYGVKVELTTSTVVPLRCAGEFLGMTEEYSEENLISKAEKYFAQVTLRSIGDSLRALKSCDRDREIAERLDIPWRCIEAIVATAPASDPALFGWPMADGGSHISQSRGVNRRKGHHDRESWLEELSILTLPVFKRLIFTMTESNLSIDLIETCLMQYANKCIPGITRSTRKAGDSTLTTEMEQRELLEMVISNLKPTRTALQSRFLFGLLRVANILKISDDFQVMLEKKIGCQLDGVKLDDLLIPSYSYLNETLYDVDCVERILHNFLERHESGSVAVDEAGRSTSLIMVGKLIDGYLSEIASDSNLNPEKFYKMAVSLPEKARLYDNGLYRAVDVYLKAHSWLSEADREKISGILDCQKLTLEACTHAAQNERLPLHTVVQVLFFEQRKLRHVIAGTLLAT